MTPTLSEVERRLVVALDAYIDEHGYSPMYDELAKALGMPFRSSVRAVIERLGARGVVTYRRGESRTLRLADRVVVHDGEIYMRDEVDQ